MTTGTVRRKQVRDETFKLLTENGLSGWRVRFNPRLTRALGRCIPSQKTIEYQPRFMEQNDWDEVVMTIRHEVAHALTPRHHHDAVWAAKCRELGGNGKATNSTATLTMKFTGTCDGCSQTWQRNRRVNGAACPSCRQKRTAEIRENGTSEQKCSIRWTRNA